MAYLNKFNNQESLINYIYSQEYSEPFVGYTADPYEVVAYNITDVMVLLPHQQKVPVQQIYPNKSFQKFPIYNNEYLNIFEIEGFGKACVVPVTVKQRTYYKIVSYDDSTNQITNPESMSTNIFAGTIIFRRLRYSRQPEDYYKAPNNGINPSYQQLV